MIEEVDQDENKEAKSEEAAQMPALPKELLSKENL